MICPACRHDNPDRAKFCLKGGSRPCAPECGTALPAAAKFCPECGHRVAMARRAAETIRSVADRLPDAALKASFLGWSRVRADHDDLDRLRRA